MYTEAAGLACQWLSESWMLDTSLFDLDMMLAGIDMHIHNLGYPTHLSVSSLSRAAVVSGIP